MAWRIVVAGGGFGGLYAARRLERLLPPQSAQVTLVADANFLLFSPLLPGAAAGTLEPRHVVVPLREELNSTDVRLGQVTGADPSARRLDYVTPDGREVSIEYDQLVVALGSVSRVLPVPGLAEHGIGFKTLSEAIALRNRALVNLEIAETLDTPEERAAWLSFVFVGAGYAGVEGIAELQDYLADVIDRYPRCRLDGTRWTLVEAGERIMPEIDPGLAEFAARELRGRGIDIRASTTLDAVTDDTATLSTGETVPCRTLVWTAGVRPTPVIAKLGLPVDERGRIVTDEYLRVPGHDGVWAIGDAAAVPDPAANRKRPTPPTAQHALRQGRLAGTNVAAALGHGHLKKFTYKTLGVFVDMGRHQAVAEMFGIRIRGFPAWFAARTYHLASMPGTTRRLRLTIDWTVGLFFGRGAPELGQLGHPPALDAGEATPSELTASG
jgi:NADH:quinone reductase (non-electrogenic)